ncbi:DUF5997 family protein [Rhodococcus sp. X156]|uniref:DUF5997 family protein n=1 Tax=Rhodococcus sp. X156 TaxID=2499145 RepID=UPI000FD8596E|nr:DUF5997 family protein [Rhodococcus sp. X156]
MKPATAAKKLEIYLPAAPAEFREGTVSRTELEELQNNPPEWLQQLRQAGPHPRSVLARKLKISIAGLARGGVTEALTTEQVDALVAEAPEWLQAEQRLQAGVRAESARQREAKQQSGKPQSAKQQSGKPQTRAS